MYKVSLKPSGGTISKESSFTTEILVIIDGLEQCCIWKRKKGQANVNHFINNTNRLLSESRTMHNITHKVEYFSNITAICQSKTRIKRNIFAQLTRSFSAALFLWASQLSLLLNISYFTRLSNDKSVNPNMTDVCSTHPSRPLPDHRCGVRLIWAFWPSRMTVTRNGFCKKDMKLHFTLQMLSVFSQL